MSQSQYSGSKGFKATAALGRGILVKLSAGEVVVATAATDAIIGVTENSCEAGEVVSVRLLSSGGTAQMKAGGTVSAGAVLTADADGEAVAATQALAGAQPTTVAVGRALEAGVDNDIIEVLLANFVY